MKRGSVSALATCLLIACGPDAKPKQTCAGQPDFVLTVRAETGLLASDTLISVKFGGDGHESYSPSAHNQRQVLFCSSNLASPSGAGGAGGSADTAPDAGGDAGAAGALASVADTGGRTIRSITCELWTGGAAWVSVRGDGYETSEALSPKSSECTGWSDLVLGPSTMPEP